MATSAGRPIPRDIGSPARKVDSAPMAITIIMEPHHSCIVYFLLIAMDSAPKIMTGPKTNANGRISTPERIGDASLQA